MVIFSIFFSLFIAPLTHADTLPYSTRTRAYNGMSSTAIGDIRTVGMSGATLGLADTFIATLENPAGLAMTVNGGDDNFSSNIIYDRNIQSYDEPIGVNSFGIALSSYPWGFSLGYQNPHEEGQPYSVPSLSPNPALIEISVREFRVSLARLLFHDLISLGVSFRFSDANLSLETPEANPLSVSQHLNRIGVVGGLSMHLGSHTLLSFSYSHPMTFNADTVANPTPGLPGFIQSIEIPWRLSAALARIPNRFFRWDFSISVLGTTDNAALIRDESIAVGRRLSIHPRLGAAYLFVDFKELQGSVFLGSSLEDTRIENTSDRLHFSGGFEVKPWIFNFGLGLDVASGYRNYLVSIGVDIFKIMSKLDLIPTPWRPPLGGWLPDPRHYSDEGLARPLVKDWNPHGKEIDPIQVGLDLPNKVEEKIEKAAQDFTNAFSKKPTPKAKVAKPITRATSVTKSKVKSKKKVKKKRSSKHDPSYLNH